MKRVTVLIPGRFVTVISSSSGPAVVKRLDVKPNDYHEHVYFDGGVQVVSIEDEPESRGRPPGL